MSMNPRTWGWFDGFKAVAFWGWVEAWTAGENFIPAAVRDFFIPRVTKGGGARIVASSRFMPLAAESARIAGIVKGASTAGVVSTDCRTKTVRHNSINNFGKRREVLKVAEAEDTGKAVNSAPDTRTNIDTRTKKVVKR